MYDKRILDVISRWEYLSWFDKKHICWISFWSQYKIGPRKFITAIVLLSAAGTLFIEHHAEVVLLAFLALFYFYTIILDHYYRSYRKST